MNKIKLVAPSVVMMITTSAFAMRTEFPVLDLDHPEEKLPREIVAERTNKNIDGILKLEHPGHGSFLSGKLVP